MRAAPAFQVSLHRFGVWRGVVMLLAGLALAVTAAWLIAHERPIASGTWAGAISATLLAVGLALSAARQRPVDLRWDGRVWQLGAATGELSIALDLGAWMLLRFTPAGAGPVAWLPVQRRGLEAPWHALRCAVYAPRPAASDDATGGA